MNTKKLFSTGLSVLLVLGTLIPMAGCNKGSSHTPTGETVKEDDPWYNATVTEVTVEEADKLEYSYCAEPATTGDIIIVPFSGSYQEGGSYVSVNQLLIYDRNGQYLASATADDSEIIGTVTEKGKATCYISDFGSQAIKKAVLDPETYELKETDSIKLESAEYANARSVDDIMVLCITNYMTEKTRTQIYKDGDLITEFDMNKEANGAHPSVISVSKLDENLIKMYVATDEEMFDLILDLSSGKFTHEDGNYFSSGSSFTDNDGNIYEAKDLSLTKNGEKYIAFTDCDVNIGMLSSVNILDVTENGAILFSQNYDNATDTSVFMLIVLDKADKNPNAGKVILTAGVPFGSIDRFEGEALQRFNSSDPDYFIRLKCYDIGEYTGSEEEYMEKYEAMVNAINMDILSNEAPDILFRSNGLVESDAFMDLKDDLKLEDDKYFTNILTATNLDGTFTNIPTSFYIEGIITKSELITEGQKGFTYDEFNTFVKDQCNGKSPFDNQYDKVSNFMDCFIAMSDLWFKDGKVALDNEEFRTFAEFAKDNLPESANAIEEGGLIYVDAGMSQPAMTAFIYGISDYTLYCSEGDHCRLLGYPSADGRGPYFCASSSVSVVKTTENKEACLKFIEMLLSEECQKYVTANPVNRETAKYLTDAYYTRCKKDYDKAVDMFGKETAYTNGYREPDRADYDYYLELLGSVDVSPMYGEYTTILGEEIQAYFAGQKSLDEVIPILENRIQTMLDEQK